MYNHLYKESPNQLHNLANLTSLFQPPNKLDKVVGVYVIIYVIMQH